MLTSLRIQNFRSIRDASVKLGQVNLFIGPNNSGKSNFLKGIKLMAHSVEKYPGDVLNAESLLALLPRFRRNVYDENIRIVAQTEETGEQAVSLIIGHDHYLLQDERPFLSKELTVIDNHTNEHKFTGYIDNSYPGEEEEYYEKSEIRNLKKKLRGLLIYKLEPAAFNLNVGLAHEAQLSANGSNIVNFLYNLGQNYKSRYRALEADFARCVQNLVSISTPAAPNEPGKLKLKLFDEGDIGYWAEEVSEGVLYFLALLCIVHQPEPPKLLLLEEPEKGIHPRRIKEVMDFIFELAQLRGIQIILTSHSPYVVNHFADIPECISVFDREGGETVIRNAADIMAETNNALVAAGQPAIRYSDGLGEYWVSGFLGGIPL